MDGTWKNLAACLIFSLLVSACVTRTINSDGSVQSSVVDTAKLSDTYVDLAIEYQQRGAPQVALDRANLAVSTDSSNPKAYMIRAMIYQALGQNEAAEKDFKKAIRLKDDYSEAYVNYAVFLCDRKRYPEAYANFAIGLNNPLYYTPEIGYFSRGKCYYQQGNLESANIDFLKSLSYRNPPQDVFVSIAQLQYQQKHFQVANYYLNKYQGSQTSATLWLHIEILQALINENPGPAKTREYTSYRNTLANLLVDNYGDTPEAQQYLLSKGGANQPLVSTITKASVATATPLVTGGVKGKDKVIVAKNPGASQGATAIAPPAPSVTSSPIPTQQGHSLSGQGVKTDSLGRHYIIVKQGDTLYSIAREYSLSAAKLSKLNNLTNGIVKVGYKLFLD